MGITLDTLARTNPPMTVREVILSATMKGVYPWVAAEAAGVSRKQFRDWMKSKESPYREFAIDVRRARGWARLAAEMALYERDSRFWLRSGPGREAPGKPGWTRDVSPKTPVKKQGQVHPLADPAWRELFEKMLEALTPYPEARAALAEMLRSTLKETGRNRQSSA